jgi:hypothetical protein
MEKGDCVVFVDPVAQEHLALVTAVWGHYNPDDPEKPGLNLVYVSENPAEEDSYGRQIKRVTSIVHQSRQAAHGNFWKEQ